jgi:hypothetical protein
VGTKELQINEAKDCEDGGPWNCGRPCATSARLDRVLPFSRKRVQTTSNTTEMWPIHFYM